MSCSIPLLTYSVTHLFVPIMLLFPIWSLSPGSGLVFFNQSKKKRFYFSYWISCRLLLDKIEYNLLFFLCSFPMFIINICLFRMKEDDPFTIRRQPVAQSTDSARTIRGQFIDPFYNIRIPCCTVDYNTIAIIGTRIIIDLLMPTGLFQV